MAAIPDFVVDADGNKYWIELGIDTGTGYHSVCGVVMRNGKRMLVPILLRIQGETMVAAVMAWYKKEFHWGHDLLNEVDNGNIPADSVMQCTKLALYEGFAAQGTSTIKDCAMDQLVKSGFTLDETYAAFFTHLFAAARDSIHETEYLQIFDKLGLDFLKSLPLRVRIALPHSFGPCASRRLRQAAISGGASSVNLISEQVCYMLAHIDKCWRGLPASMTGTFVLVDAGCGTINSVKYMHSGGEGAHSRFKAITQSTGSVSGSQKVNQLVLEMIESQVPEGMQSVYTRLNKEPNEFNFELLGKIEKAKKEFRRHHIDKPDKILLAIAIVNYVTKEEFGARVTSKMVQAASDAVFAEFIPTVDVLFTPNESTSTGEPRFIILCGGYGQSHYLYYQFVERYKGTSVKIIQMSGDATLVAVGALSSSFASIDVQGLPLRFHWAILQDQSFHWSLHPDCWDRDKAGRRRANTKKVRRQVVGSPLDHRTVLSRLLFVARKGERPDQTKPIIQVFHPFVDDPVVTVTLVCTEGDYGDYQSALEDDHDVTRHDNKLRKDIHLFTEGTWTLDKGLMESGLWNVAEDSETGRLRYENVHIITGIRCTEEHDMTMKLEVILPDKQTKVSNKDGKTVNVEGIATLWNPRGPDLLSDADAGSGPLPYNGESGDAEGRAGLVGLAGGNVDADGDQNME